MLDSVKHSIVLLQIAKNTAVPINGTYTGDKMLNGEDATSSLDIPSHTVFPDTSYSSSEGEDDYFDAHDDSAVASSAVSPTTMYDFTTIYYFNV